MSETNSKAFCAAFLELRAQHESLSSGTDTNVTVDGQTLSVAAVIASARHPHLALQLSSEPRVRANVEAARQAIEGKLAAGKSVYGLTTGFGGSADTRTMDSRSLGKSLLQHLQVGVLPPTNAPSEDAPPPKTTRSTLSISSDALTNVMPESWVRAAIVVRMNSLIRGHSGVRWEFIEGLRALLENNIIPVVPVRGSVSASGDLSPLSYIAGTLMGNPRIRVFYGPYPSDPEHIGSSRRVVSCVEAFRDAGLTHLVFEAKEHLGVLNGTAFSAGVASLAMGDAMQAGVLSMVCTALGTEALLGTQASHAKFIHEEARPHPGQVEAAHVMHDLLRGSEFAHLLDEGDNEEEECSVQEDAGTLRQDRYPLRTSPQFIGPQLQDLLSALKTVTIECNSTTDNPLIDPRTSQVHHGGNFQAMAVTNAMESTRLAIFHLGKLLFAQMTELLNPLFNRGLPPSLAASDPSTNYFAKGLDTAAASYVSELGWLANNVGTFAQSAEMHNQAVNSLALISARATIAALDVFAMLAASYLVVLCQAVDLRTLNALLLTRLDGVLPELITKHLLINSPSTVTELSALLRPVIRSTFDHTTTRDAAEQGAQIASACTAPIMDFMLLHPEISSQSNVLSQVADFRLALAREFEEKLQSSRRAFLSLPDNSSFVNLAKGSLAHGTRPVYAFIRETLGLRMLGLDNLLHFTREDGFSEPLVGDHVSAVYESIRDGRLAGVLADVLTKLDEPR